MSRAFWPAADIQQDHLFPAAERHRISKSRTFSSSGCRTDSAVYYQYGVGLAWLFIGLFVYYRRTNSPKALHFFLLCLVSFIASCFHYSGKLNNFDQVIYWGNIVAGLLAPSLFLHFCLTFPEKPKIGWASRGRWLLLYARRSRCWRWWRDRLPALLRFGASLIEVRWLLDRLMLGFFVAMYLLGAACADAGLSPGRGSDAAAAVEVSAQRSAGRYAAVCALLRASLCVRRGARVT